MHGLIAMAQAESDVPISELGVKPVVFDRYVYVQASWLNGRTNKRQSTTIAASKIFGMGPFEPESQARHIAQYLTEDASGEMYDVP